jgi:alpha-tubulin suppressor-like RCC1 family protein
MNTRLIAALGTLVLTAALGCRDDAPSPTAPAEPAAAALAAAATPLAFRQVSAGASHSCGVTADDRAYCWGFNFTGQLGIGTMTGPERCGDWPCSTRPVAVFGGLRFREVSAGATYTCGVTTDDRAFCWGYNAEGQLGDGTTATSLTPVALAFGRRLRQVRAGSNHTCGINPFDVAFCWGANFVGQLGDGTTTQRLTPVRVVGGLRWHEVSAGAGYTCGVTTDDRAYCWGNNGNGQLGDGTRTGRIRPAAVTGGLLFRQIDAGTAHTCAVSAADYRAYCWGYDGFGQLGDGTAGVNARPRPTAVAGTRRFDHVSAGDVHTCGVTRAGRGFCWGRNDQGQLGDGTTAQRVTPVPIGLALDLRQVSAGQFHTCGVTTTDRAYCWGDNTYGQLGDGSTADRLLPTAVVGP